MDKGLSLLHPSTEFSPRTLFHIPVNMKKPLDDHSVFLSESSNQLSRANSCENGAPVSVIVSEKSFSSSDGETKKAEYQYRPQPMIRKSKRRFVEETKKDGIYWERRQRNNEAAKRSREQRRDKEIEINRKCESLISENVGLKFTIQNLQERNNKLEDTVSIYKDILQHHKIL